MQNLIDAIVLCAGYELNERNGDAFTRFARSFADPEDSRRDWFHGEVVELRKNSGFETEAECRQVTAGHVVEAVRIKVEAHLRSLGREGYIVHYANGGKPMHCKTHYMREGDARRAAAKRGYVYSTTQAYVAATRARLVRSAMNGALVMETTGTPFTSSVASESYWSN